MGNSTQNKSRSNWDLQLGVLPHLIERVILARQQGEPRKFVCYDVLAIYVGLWFMLNVWIIYDVVRQHKYYIL